MRLNNYIFLTIGFTLVSLTSCSQKEDTFKVSDYVYYSKGADMGYPYVLIFKNKSDTNRTYKEVYFDSSYSQLIFRSFFLNDISNGPFFSYVNGKVFIESWYKDGLLDGKRVIYRNEKVSTISYFKKGIKTGIWIEFDSQGKKLSQTKYDDEGNEVERITY